VLNAAQVLAGLPQGLRDELLESYQGIMASYAERRWRGAELDGGRFCEIVFSIVEGALKGAFPPRAFKPSSMFQSCIGLESKYPPTAARVGDRSLRIMIPRLLPVLYEVRNNRNVGHVGGDVNPDHMDAEAVQSMASWLMAELVRIFHGVSTREAEETVDALVERKTPLIWEVEGTKRVLEENMSAKDQTLLLLHHSTGWVDVDQLVKWVEYSNPTVFRLKVLKPMHDQRLIEYDADSRRSRISPKGAKDVEGRLLKRR
jgi:hypothetical protein